MLMTASGLKRSPHSALRGGSGVLESGLQDNLGRGGDQRAGGELKRQGGRGEEYWW